MKNEDLKARIKRLRKEKRLSQLQLAEICGCRQPQIYMWEVAGKKPMSDKLFILAKTFGVTMDYLYLGVHHSAFEYKEPEFTVDNVFEDAISIADRIKRAMKLRDYSVDMICSVTEIDKKKIEAYLSQKEQPTIQAIKIIAESLGVDKASLAFGS